MDVEGPIFLGDLPNIRVQRRRAVLAAAILLIIAALGALFNGPVIPGLAAPIWAILIAGTLAQFATAAVLWGTLRGVPRRSVMPLIAAAVLGGLVMLTLILTSPWNTGQAPILRVDQQASAYAGLFARALFGLSALGYSVLRRYELANRQPPWALVFGWVAALAALTAIVLVLGFAAPSVLPPLMGTDALDAVRVRDLLATIFVLAAGGAAAVWTMKPKLYRIDRAVALSAFAIALDTLLVLHDTRRYTTGSLCARFLDMAACSFILVAAVQRLFGGYYRLSRAVKMIDRTQRVALRQTQRLAAVWRLASDEHLGDAERFQALLDVSSGAIRPGRPFFGEIGHQDGDDFVIDASSDAYARDERAAVESRLPPRGTRLPLEDTLQYEIAQAGGTVSFNDLTDIVHGIRRPQAARVPWQSLIGTTFAVGNTNYFVAFASTETMLDDQFTEDDHAFIDVLAAFLAGQLQQGRQLAQIRYQIEHDHLTGLPSRSPFRTAVLRDTSLGIPCAVAIVALDRFREINETFGHMTGDAILVEIAAALRGARQAGDFVARLGGDNFAILVDDVATTPDAEARLAPYRDVFNRPFSIGDRDGKESLRVGASFGVALYPQDASAFEQLLARADAAVESAKQRQRGSVVFFNDNLQRSIERRRSLHVELAAAVSGGQLTVRYQPTIELWSRQIVGAEALVRWQHPQQGMVLPDEFIPFAESNGMIGPIGRWVMERVFADLGGAISLPEQFRCYINLSGHQFADTGFIAALRDQFSAHPHIAGHIGIEITETVAMSDVDRTLDALSILRELGVVIALDDFGTGYSSLSYLKRLPLDIIKIDKSFVRGLPNDQHDAGLVETVIAVANRFGFKTLAEGVETVEQYDWLRARGCTYGQGYLIARPMTFAQFAPWLARKTFTFGRS
jgi:diguanylate cyclase (GGDEF)-like protein